ncbi:MAG: hypothetical protein QXX41_03125 [Nitrososphaerota archaeon]
MIALEKLHMFGISLLVFSIPFMISAYLLLNNTTLTALGIGLLILSVSILLTPARAIPPHAVRALLEGSVLSLEAILEEFDVSERGYYALSPNGRVYVYVPIHGKAKPPSIASEPSGLIYKEGELEYLVLVPPASELVKSSELSGMDVESALNYVLIDLMEIADSVEIIMNDLVSVKLRKVKSQISAGRFKNVFGSLEANIIACILANFLGIIRVMNEVDEDDDKIIVLEVL